jgi:hypothetical protein
MGEFLESTSLQRVFKNFSDIEMELPTWSQRLYGAMVQHAQLVAIDATRLDEEPTQ